MDEPSTEQLNNALRRIQDIVEAVDGLENPDWEKAAELIHRIARYEDANIVPPAALEQLGISLD